MVADADDAGRQILGVRTVIGWARTALRPARPSASPCTHATTKTAHTRCAHTNSVTAETSPAAKATPAQRLKRREKGGPSLREELVEVVREDPEAAANVLRSWINSAT